jgi:hypothetical protein
MSTALYVRDGDQFHPTESTRSLWSSDVQHGGPPVGLLARAIEQAPTAVPMQVVRLTVDLFRGIPVDQPMMVDTNVIRDGRRIQVIEAVLAAAGQPVARASGLKIRTTDVPLSEALGPWIAPPRPDEADAISWGRFGFTRTDEERFHSHAIEVRTIGDSFFTLGEGLSWVRLVVPVVENETTTPFVQTATLSDVGNGNSMALDGRDWLFVNPDVSLTLHRLPGGPWLGMRSLARQHASGIGSADSELFDVRGPVGRVLQSQILEPRSDSRTT